MLGADPRSEDEPSPRAPERRLGHEALRRRGGRRGRLSDPDLPRRPGIRPSRVRRLSGPAGGARIPAGVRGRTRPGPVGTGSSRVLDPAPDGRRCDSPGRLVGAGAVRHARAFLRGFVVLQNAVDFPGVAAQTIVSGGVPSARYLDVVEKNLASFEPAGLREGVTASWERETSVQTPEEMDRLWLDQSPFHFADPLDPRIDEYNAKSTLVAGAVYSPAVLRHFAAQDYGQIEVEDRLGEIPQPVLVLAGRHDRVCSVEAAESLVRGIPNAELVVFEESGHMTFVEETVKYLDAVDGFLNRHRS